MSDNKIVVMVIAIAFFAVMALWGYGEYSAYSFEKSLEVNNDTLNKERPIQNYERYQDGRQVGYSIAYYFYKFVDEKFKGDIEFMEDYKIFFIQRMLKRLEINSFEEDFKKGIYDGFNFSWNRKIKQIALDKEEDEIIREIILIFEDVNNLPVSKN